jgi:radical SAM protein (TIGR01212 family)
MSEVVENSTHEAPPPEWDGKPYFPISLVYRQRFGSKVVKIPVSIADNCPNRAGIKGMQTCIFCDEHGSFAYPENQNDELRSQILKHREKVATRFNASQFLIYFQAYTTTFTQVKRLEQAFETALSYDDVKGLVVGTRPDTLSEGVLKLWREYAQKTFVGIELGVQSFDDDQLVWMRRGHTGAQAIKGVERVAREAGVDVGIHLIFGWPTETDKQIIETAELCNSLPITNVKLHNLHVIKNTPLEALYASGEFIPVELDLYAHRVALFLERLNPRIAVHRLAALSSRWEELIAPQWTRHKMKSYQGIIDRINERGTWQGKLFRG